MTVDIIGSVVAVLVVCGLGIGALRWYVRRPSRWSTGGLAASVAAAGVAVGVFAIVLLLRYDPALLGIELPRWPSTPQVQLHFSHWTVAILALIDVVTGLILAIVLRRRRSRTEEVFTVAGAIGVFALTALASGGATLVALRSAPRELTKPPEVGWAQASGEVANLELPLDTVQEIVAASAREGEEDLAQTAEIVSTHEGASIYNAVISPVAPSTQNVLLDKQDTHVDFFIGQASPGNAVPQENAKVSPEVTLNKDLDVTLTCSFCLGSRLQRGTISIQSNPVLHSSHTNFNIKPDKTLTSDDTGHLIFQVTSKSGILVDSVVVPVAIQSPGVTGQSVVATTTPFTALGTYASPPNSRPVDLTIYCSSDGQAVQLRLDPTNEQLKTLFGGREREPGTNQERVFTARFTWADLSGRLREDQTQLGAMIDQDPVLQRALTGDPNGATVIPQITKLSTDQERILMDQVGNTGKFLYAGLFGTAKELQEAIGIVENFKRSDGKPLLIRIVTESISLPWQFLHPLGPANADGFWGFKYELVVDPAPDKKGYYPADLHYGNGPLIFGKYHAGVGDRNQLVDSKGQTEYANLSSTLGFKGVLPVADSRKLFLDELTDHRPDLQMLVVFTHARNDVTQQPGATDVALGQSGGGPALAFSPTEFVTVNTLENLQTSVALPAVFEFAQHPLVVLNGCTTGSASFLAIGNRTFPGTFLSFGARGVVATEAPVWALFADDFGTSLLRSMVTKIPVSSALLETRKRYVHDSNNPLGLLYTYYGGVDSSLDLQ